MRKRGPFGPETMDQGPECKTLPETANIARCTGKGNEKHVALVSDDLFRLKDGGSAHSCADTHGDDAYALACALQLVQQGCHLTCPRATQWMTQRDRTCGFHTIRGVSIGGAAGSWCTSTRVKFVQWDAQLPHTVGHLRGKRLVQLEYVHLIHRDPCRRESSGNGHGRAYSHLVRLDTNDSV